MTQKMDDNNQAAMALSLEPLNEVPRNEPASTPPQATAEQEEGSGLSTTLWTISELKFPIFLLITGLFLAIMYSPYPDGFLRKGFIAGAVILFWGLKSYRARA